MPLFKPAEQAVVKASLPTPEVTSDYDEATKKLTIVSVFDMDYPDEAIIERLGRVPKDEKGNPTGEPKPVTSKTYGRGRKIPLGSADADNNMVLLNIQVFAQSAEAEAEAENTEE